jgi:hypothetical protein
MQIFVLIAINLLLMGVCHVLIMQVKVVQVNWPLEIIPQGLPIDDGGGGNEVWSLFFYCALSINT